ncbi:MULTISPECIES: OprD family outer membrane porin [Pseudomonas]|uniref:OprD family outer membrane porin n=1 Tax=Pseudomonas TaxID=286 RepID=UPI00157308D7|nr:MULTISPECIES: OprD family outer membrane porin [Pseudomonas]MBG6128071.1 hypothetical protein [Pseudomonas sp. M2]NSX19119.1 outer membrane porin, OprD family [Pseudomonas putida]HDS1743947.1 OprD family outer membrane porin [Pseudomonas putida]
MRHADIAVITSLLLFGGKCVAGGFVEDATSSLSTRGLYFENDVRERGGADQRQSAMGIRLDLNSGYTPGLLGFGLEVQALVGIGLGGGIDNQSATTVNTVTPVNSDGSPVDEWSRMGGNAKLKLSATELKIGNALAPNLPVLVSNNSRVMPQIFEGAMLTSKEFRSVTVTGGKITDGSSRASSNYSALAANGGARGSNGFWFAGADWAVTKNLLVQYYHAELEDYYKQNFFGLVHTYPIASGHTLKTDLRFFENDSEGRVGSSGYVFNNAGGYARKLGQVDNTTWSATFTYSTGGHALLVGYQSIGDDGAMVYVNPGSVRDGKGSLEGQGGASVYLYTDVMANTFVRAGEDTTYAQYSYDFAATGIPGLKASVMYLSGRNIKDRAGGGQEYSEWERDLRLDYVIQSGPLKNFGATLMRGSFRTEVPGNQGGADIDQTRLYLNYSYHFK